MTTSTALDHVASRLATALLTGRHGPCLAGFPVAGGPPEVVPLGDRHPLEVLWASRPSGCWHAVVVAAAGRVVPLGGAADGDDGDDLDRPPIGAPVVVAAVTGPCGPDRSLVLGIDGRPLLTRSEVTGLVPDACRRAVGRSTTPAEVPVTAWWATEWLADVVDAVERRRGPCTLGRLVGLHPAVELEELPTSTADLIAFAVERGWDHAHLTGWDGVRRSVAAGLVPDPAGPPELAAWFDAGSFSRYAQATRPSAGELLAGLRTCLPAAVVAGLARILELWQLGAPR